MVVFFYIDVVMTCKWVCIDKNNNIKKHYFDQTKFNLEFHQHEISLPTYNKNQKNNDKGRKNVDQSLPIPGKLLIKNKSYKCLFVDICKIFTCLLERIFLYRVFLKPGIKIC